MPEVWKKCGHERTPENTSSRECRCCKNTRTREQRAIRGRDPEYRARKRELEAARKRERRATDPEWAEKQRERSRERYANLSGEAYNQRLLKGRRYQALQRRRARELRNNEET